MRQLTLKISAFAFLALAASCGSSGTGGQLVGVNNTLNYKAPVPLGMVSIPPGVLKMGASDEDVRGRNDALLRTVQMSGYYMDATEISNAEYRQFTNAVRDSIGHTLLGDFIEDDNGGQRIDYRKKINYNNPDVQDQLAGLYLDATQSGWGKKIFDNSKLVYHYETFDYAASVANPNQPQTEFIRKKDIAIYPDTAVWMRQFNYSYNEPIALQYNWFPAFNNYPVVGVNYFQAEAFCHWRTNAWKAEREKNKLYFEGQFRIPNEMEWEWAARGGRHESPFPWGGPYVVNKKGCYLANFKPQRGNYAADGGLYTVPVDRYWPNDYGLYNMSGNVSEWTSTNYGGTNYQSVADLNPNIRTELRENDPRWLRRKVVRGGSWRDVQYYLQVGTRDWEEADTAKSYIGFRCVYTQVYPGTTGKN